MPEPTFLFYDLETTGLDPKKDRIMQFAAQRTDLELNLVGEPFNLIVALTEDVLPSVTAIITTGITPQFSRREGITEAEFVAKIQHEAFTPATIPVGFNTVRFDDEFLRYTFYRNFYDPYEWNWLDDRSRWDILDVVRMTRALRPEGINWPIKTDGTPVNRLELITKLNDISHQQAHDALSDVIATIDVARLIKTKQPELFDYLFKLRHKKEVAKIVNVNHAKPFVYSSGSFGTPYDFTSVCVPIGLPDTQGRVIVYDLRRNPTDYDDLTANDLKAIRYAKRAERQREGYRPFPAKRFAFNQCPAVAPLGVLRHDDQERIKLDLATIEYHWQLLKSSNLIPKLITAMEPTDYPPSSDVDAALYDGFFGPNDKKAVAAVRSATSHIIGKLEPHFSDQRLPELFLRYKARNFPASLSPADSALWETYRAKRLAQDLPAFEAEIQAAATDPDPTTASLLEDLKLWAQSIMPTSD